MDTDSVIYSNPTDEDVSRVVKLHKTDMGAFKFEEPLNTIETFRAIAPKIYYYNDKKFKAKGLRLSDIRDVNL